MIPRDATLVGLLARCLGRRAASATLAVLLVALAATWALWDDPRAALGVLHVGALAMTVIVGAGLIDRALADGSLATLLTWPLTRSRLFLLHVIALVAVVGGALVVATAAVAIVGRGEAGDMAFLIAFVAFALGDVVQTASYLAALSCVLRGHASATVLVLAVLAAGLVRRHVVSLLPALAATAAEAALELAVPQSVMPFLAAWVDGEPAPPSLLLGAGARTLAALLAGMVLLNRRDVGVVG